MARKDLPALSSVSAGCTTNFRLIISIYTQDVQLIYIIRTILFPVVHLYNAKFQRWKHKTIGSDQPPTLCSIDLFFFLRNRSIETILYFDSAGSAAPHCHHLIRIEYQSCVRCPNTVQSELPRRQSRVC